MDAQGQSIAKTGYRPGGADEYVKNLKELMATYEGILALKGKLVKAKGLDRAKLLDEIVTGTDKLGVEDENVVKYGEEIIALDPNNKAGLKVKYTFRKLLAEAVKFRGERNLAEAKAVLEKAAALPGISAEQKQDFCFSLGECTSWRRISSPSWRAWETPARPHRIVLKPRRSST